MQEIAFQNAAKSKKIRGSMPPDPPTSTGLGTFGPSATAPLRKKASYGPVVCWEEGNVRAGRGNARLSGEVWMCLIQRNRVEVSV